MPKALELARTALGQGVQHPVLFDLRVGEIS
jgi:hypothetical protein